MTQTRHTTRRNRGSAGVARGFTLIEALAAIMVMLIVIPILLQGFAVASGIATESRQRADATAMAQSKLDEILALQLWQAGLAEETQRIGVYDYTCSPTLEQWDSGEMNIQLLKVTVSWKSRRGTDRSLTLTTLVWQPTTTYDDSTSTGITGVLP